MLRSFFPSVFALIFIILSTNDAFAFPADIDSSNSQISFVELEATLSEKIIHFKWKVEREKNGHLFVIEKSIDERTWEKVHEVSSIRNHQSEHVYQISQINLAETAYEYFRLIRIDQYGHSSVLDEVTVNHPILTNLLLIPTSKSGKKEFVISYNSMLCCDGKIVVRDANNTIIFKRKIHFNEGYNRLVLDTKNYEKGDYKVLVENEYLASITKDMKIESLKARRTKF